ncbi:MAG: flavin monoamine oxidase family protein [Betaproteobacteria bacterium]
MVGAGAAGLAAADALARSARSVLILEARDRVGGRCWTRRVPGIDAPVELGAEFIHGEAKATHRLLRQARIPAVASVREQRWLDRSRLRPVNAFVEAQRAMRDASAHGDVSFERFLAGKRLPRKTGIFARLMVQGFDAADPKRVSARSIADEWSEAGSLGASQPRPRGGYGALMDWLAARAVKQGARLQLGAAVREVRWRPGSVLLRGTFAGRAFAFTAKKAVITLPLGVLQAVRFAPRLEKSGALQKLASGPVIRVAMGFHEPFWEKRAPGVAFFHVPDAPFPTFWTPLPMRARLLTAWAGGPKAAALTGLPAPALVDAALLSVERVFGKRARRLLAFAIAQDWEADPFSRGGYSYVLVGGKGAREELARPVADTLYFAGEATDSEEAGTVAGALRSGQRAAQQIIG